MIRDFNIEWLEKKRYIPAQLFQNYITGASVGAGDTVFVEIGTTGITGLKQSAADTAATLIELTDVDMTKQIRFRVCWTQTSTTATDAATWIVLYTPIQIGDNVAATLTPAGTVLIDPATALSTAIPALDLSVGVASVIQMSDYGKINGKVLADTTYFLAVSVEMDAVTTFSADEVIFMGLEMSYTPRLTAGPRRNLVGGKRLNPLRPLSTLLTTGQEGL